MADIATLGLRVKAEGIDTANRGLDTLTKKSSSAEKAALNLRSSFLKLAGPIAAAATAIFGVSRSVSTLANFEKSMSAVQAITRASASELAALRDVAKELGATTEYSASQAADALKFLGMAGFQASEAIAAIPAVLDLATASAMGLAEAADVSSNIMSGFGLSADQAGKAADILAAAATRANTDVSQLGAAMKFAAPVAHSLGISMGDTAAAIGVMSDAGIQGSQAGTGLRAVLASLVKPSKEGQEALKAMGLTIKDINPQTKTLAEIFTTLKDRGLNAQAAMMLFGREAASAGLSMAAASSRLGELSGQLKSVDGEAKRMASTMRDNLSGDINNLTSASEGLIIAIGESGVTNALRVAFQAATTFIGVLSEMAAYLPEVAFAAGAVATVLGVKFIAATAATPIAIMRIAAAIQGSSTAMVAAQVAAYGLGRAIGSIGAVYTALGGPIGVAVGAITTVLYFLNQRGNEAAEASNRYAEAIKKAGENSSTAKGGIEEASKALFGLAKNASAAEGMVALDKAMKVADDSMSKMRLHIGDLTTSFWSSTREIGQAIKVLREQFDAGEITVEEFNAELDILAKNNPDHSKKIVDIQALAKVIAAARGEVLALNNALNFVGPQLPEKFGPHLPEGWKSPEITPVVTLPELNLPSGGAKETVDHYKELIRSAQQRIDQMQQEVSLVGVAGVAADTMRMKLDLLHQAQEKGLKLTPKQKAELNGLADAYGVAAQKVAELQLAEEARFERAQLFRSPIDARIASDLRNAGLEMDSVAGQAYASYVKLTDQISTAKDGAKEFASGFINDLLNGKSAIESVANALKKLGDKLIDMALDEMINGLFKNLMGVFNMGGGGAIGALSGQFAASGGIGLFADGGVTNKPAIFGEAGPEAAVPLPDGRTIPVTLNAPQGSGGGTVNSGNVYNFTGTSEEFQQFKKFVQERDRQFDSRAQHAVTKGNKQNRFR